MSGCSGFCGDDGINGSEVCDGLNLDDNDCTTVGGGFTGGTLACNPDCLGWDTSGCTTVVAVCGNGTVEVPEECDDGNLRSHDGCSSCCTVESPQWANLSPASRPNARFRTSMAYDRGRDRVVLFGGQSDSTTKYAETWEFDGSDWTEAAPARNPPRK